MDSPISLIFPVLAAIFYGSQYIPQKKLSKVNTNNYNLSMTFGILITTLGFFSCLFLTDQTLNFIPIIFAVIGGIIWQMGNGFSLIAIEAIGMSKTASLLNLVSIFSFIFGLFFFSEEVNVLKIIGLPIIVSGAIIITLTRKEDTKKFNWKGIASVIISAFLISIFNVFSVESMASRIYPTIPYFTATFFLSVGAVIGSLLSNFRIRKIKNWVYEGKKFHLYALLAGFIWSCGILLTSYTLANYGLSFGVPIIQTVMAIISAIWGIVYFKEINDKKNIIQFFIGLIISIVGIFLFGIS
ncbi:MAG: GRP family sugar transporter [Candidatus Helarchaeota archaeon]